MDTFLAAALSGQASIPPSSAVPVTASRARVQDTVKSGLVMINGRATTKASTSLKAGDVVHATLLPPPQLQALPEPIPLDIVYEDEHLMVVNKPAGMAVHISVGHHTGTLVNALLHHCGLPGIKVVAEACATAEAVGGGCGGAGPHDAAGSVLHSLMGGPAAGDEAWRTLLGQPVGAACGDELDDGDEDDGEAGDQPAAPAANALRPSSGRPGGSGPAAGTGGGGGEVRPGAGSAQGLVRVVGAAGGQPGVLRPGIVHRLDIGTSGLLVVAKREGAQRDLSAQFKARTVSVRCC